MDNDLKLREVRRSEFAAHIGDAVAVIPAAIETVRNDDVHHAFRQSSDFFFLTGFDEPDAVAVIDPASPAEQYVLFVRPRDRELEIWNGYRAGVDGARTDYGADAAYPIDELDQELRRRLLGRSAVYVPMGNAAFRSRVADVVAGMGGLAQRFGRVVPSDLCDSTPVLNDLRLRKTDAELAAMRIACAISAEGHIEAMRFTAPGRYEYQVQAAMEYVFRMRGSRRDGYPAIVAGGANACILHYTENDQLLRDGDLLLIDAGAEYRYHSADITRTFPVGGRFSSAQRAVYDMVLAAQHASLAIARSGSTMRQIHQASVDAIAAGLVDLGLLPGSAEDATRMHHYRDYFMHGAGHWLGMDVHDAGAYGVEGKPRPLEPGMAFTVEPGVYIAPDRPELELAMFEYDIDEWVERRMMLGIAKAKELEAEEREKAPKVSHPVPEAFRGIGVRIEDDIVITESGYDNLTAAAPTSPDEVEQLAQTSSELPSLDAR
ncbi:MAG: aminopeptidase P N-terminal domain-containing protein [Acidimicrobiia bacterium]|nr:aminopeptidase P N-terminal domain-containing protein [Acidimicrobiia bacterium]